MAVRQIDSVLSHAYLSQTERVLVESGGFVDIPGPYRYVLDLSHGLVLRTHIMPLDALVKNAAARAGVKILLELWKT
jgi:hypothetical protein